MDKIAIAPGLSTEVELEFLAPTSTVTPPIPPPNTARQPQEALIESETPVPNSLRKKTNVNVAIEALGFGENGNAEDKQKTNHIAEHRGLSAFVTPAMSSKTTSIAPATDPSSCLYEDTLGVDILGSESQFVSVPIRAFPAGPRLVFKKDVDFGVLVYGLDRKKGADKKVEATVCEENSQHEKKQKKIVDGKQGSMRMTERINDDDNSFNFSKEKPIAIDYIEIKNVGKRVAKFKVLYDSKKIPLRITPHSVSLGCPQGGQGIQGLPNSTLLKIEFFYSGVGRFKEEVKIELENPIPVFGFEQENQADKKQSEKVESNNIPSKSKLSFVVSSTVVNHKLRLRNQDNTHDLDPLNLHFGTIYYSQCAFLAAKLENRGPTLIQWVITHAGESSPMVPSPFKVRGNYSEDSKGLATLTEASGILENQADAENKASMSVVPSEGLLNPYQTSDIVFNFAPRIQDTDHGFKTTKSGPPTQIFRVPMQLKIITTAADNSTDDIHRLQVGEEPIDILMTGRACPIQAALNKKEITFNDIILNQYHEEEEEVILQNGSDQLGFRYRFTTAAHFHTFPQSGCLGPLQSTVIKVTCKPNQLGQFATELKCIISSLEDVPTFELTDRVNRTPLLVKLEGDEESRDIFSLSLNLTGKLSPSVPTILDSNKSQLKFNINELQGSSLRTNDFFLTNHDSFSESLPTIKEWQEKAKNRHLYWDYLKQSRMDRLINRRKSKFGDDGVSIDYGRLLLDVNSRNIDSENGLLPPEPTDFERTLKSSENVQGNIVSLTEILPEDTRKIKSLFQQLYDPSLIKSKLASSILSTPTTVNGAHIDVPLTGADLANVFTAHSSLDFGEVTVHSVNSLPLNFMNASPNRLPIHIRLLVDKDGTPESVTESNTVGELKVLQASLILPPMSVSGVEVTFKSDKPGIFRQKITYLVNGRYKYQLPVRVVVCPIRLSLSSNRILLEVPNSTNALISAEPKSSGSDDTARNGFSADILNVLPEVLREQPWESLPKAEKLITLHNEGNFSAGFSWTVGSHVRSVHTSRQSIFDGTFFVEPLSGSIPAKGSADIRIIFIPGVKALYEETLMVEVIDEVSTEESEKISSVLTLDCRGEISSAACVLITSVKQGPIDLGTLPVLYSGSTERNSTLRAYNIFAAYDLFPIRSVHQAQASGSSVHPQSTKAPPPLPVTAEAPIVSTYSSQSKGCRVIRIKNTSTNSCYFLAQTLKENVEVEIFPRFGFIQGSGGILEITILAIPTKIAIVEDVVLVTIIGGSRSIKIPFKYESRTPLVEVGSNTLSLAQDFKLSAQDMKDPTNVDLGTVIGSWSVTPLIIANVGGVTATGVIDLRDFPEFQFAVKSLQESEQPHQVAGMPSLSVARVSSSAQNRRGTKSTASQQPVIQTAAVIKENFRIITADDELYSFAEHDFRQMLIKSGNGSWIKRRERSLPESRTEEKQHGSIYVFEIQPGERLNAELIFKPKSIKRHEFDLPLYIIGMENVPSVKVALHAVPSPIVVSKTSVNFKNKVVFRDLGMIGVSHLKNVAKETLTITNNSDKRITWSFDVEPLEEDDGAFKLDPWHGSLDAGAAQSINVSFQPETVGLFDTVLPLHIDYLGRHAPFVLSLQGTGVEPSIAFEPSEIFLPIVPLGVETTTAFSIVNYGCDRTEIKHVLSDDIFSRSGILELHFPEGKLLKSDGEKLTVVVRFVAFPPVSNGHNTHVEQLGAGDGTSKRAEKPPYYGGPISFTTKIEFSDNNHRSFYLPIHGTSDNSFLTLQPYLWRTRADYRFTVAEIPAGHIAYVSKKTAALLDENQRSPRTFRTPAGIPFESNDSYDVFLGLVGETLSRWLKDHLTTASTGEFPSQFSSNPKSFGDLIQSVSGRKMPSMPIGAFTQSASPIERAKSVQKYLKDLLNLMISAGALLSSVKPEFLMSLEEYRHVSLLQLDSSSNHKGIVHEEMLDYARKLEAEFHVIQKEAWVIVLLQTVKVYVSSLVTVKHFRSLPGVEADELDISWPKTGNLKRITNFGEDFKDSSVIASLITSHIPGLEQIKFALFNPMCETTEQLLSNAKMTNAALMDIFNFPGILLPVDSVLRGDCHLEIMVLLLFLFQTLPHFMPKASVEFRGSLHDKVIKSIEISNPSNRALMYTAQLHGSQDFTMVEGQTLVVAPKSQSKISLQFLSRFANQAKGQLKLQTRKIGLNSASILVFDLFGHVDPPQPRGVFKIEAPMYCTPPATIDVEVSTPFNTPGLFRVTLKQIRRTAPLILLNKGRPATEIHIQEIAIAHPPFDLLKVK
ncbi:Cilia- and flagella-associated protein 47 [Phlyctochytrium planicorne]|nr:Cilia- and flagella-associated protein 47 [Phlyctochytrium planicorne]